MSGQHTLSSAARGYGYGWRKARAAKLAQQDRCEIKGPNCTGKATTVDHIDENGPDDPGNLRSACLKCHMEVTAKMVGLGTHIGVGRKNVALNNPKHPDYTGPGPRAVNPNRVQRFTVPASRAQGMSRAGSFGEALRAGIKTRN